MKRYIAGLAFLVITFPLAVAAQNAPDITSLASKAGLIFIGTIARVDRVDPAAPGEIGLTRITFRVQDGFRGAVPGQMLTMSEWGGLWTAGDRYRVGETLLLFFYPPSGQLGLTTTVAGAAGRISLAQCGLSAAAVRQQLSGGRTRHAQPHPATLWKSRRNWSSRWAE